MREDEPRPVVSVLRLAPEPGLSDIVQSVQEVLPPDLHRVEPPGHDGYRRQIDQSHLKLVKECQSHQTGQIGGTQGHRAWIEIRDVIARIVDDNLIAVLP